MASPTGTVPLGKVRMTVWNYRDKVLTTKWGRITFEAFCTHHAQWLTDHDVPAEVFVQGKICAVVK